MLRALYLALAFLTLSVSSARAEGDGERFSRALFVCTDAVGAQNFANAIHVLLRAKGLERLDKNVESLVSVSKQNMCGIRAHRTYPKSLWVGSVSSPQASYFRGQLMLRLGVRTHRAGKQLEHVVTMEFKGSLLREAAKEASIRKVDL